ncbi:MAG: LysR family transcriptional regulator [Bdellovibrionales bacterium]|nr:LysR family transcriptional regulator [Bdellovibrionales bacterium]
MFDLNEILSFVAIAEQGSVTKASQVTQIPKSTLSRHLINLERRLGITLFQRTTRRVTLTVLGQEYYQSCSISLNKIFRDEKNLTESLHEPKGLIRFTAPLEIGTYFFSETIAEFVKKYPEIHLDLNYTDRVIDLVKDGYDLALRAGAIKDQSLISKKFGQDQFIIVASPNYIKNAPEIIEIDDLKKHKCWLNSQMPNSNVWKLEKKNIVKKVVLDKKYMSNSIQTIKNIIIAGGGIGFLPFVLIKNSLLAGELNQVLPQWKSEGGNMHLCYPRLRKMPVRLRLFIDHLLQSKVFSEEK